MLLVGDIGVGLALTVLGLIVQHRRRTGMRTDEVGTFVRTVLASFGLAVLMVDGIMPGFWMIGNYALYGGPLDGHVLPGSGVDGLLRAMSIGLVIMTAVGVMTYWSQLFPTRRR